MPGQPRSFPGRPSLRYLKLEAKRRLSAGEFGALHEAQLAVAREHGLPSWAALKQRVGDPLRAGGPVLTQLRWVIARFKDSGGIPQVMPDEGTPANDPAWEPFGAGTQAANPAWTEPDENELREHFDSEFLSVMPPATLIPLLVNWSTILRRKPLVVLAEAPLAVRARIGGIHLEAAAAAGRRTG